MQITALALLVASASAIHGVAESYSSINLGIGHGLGGGLGGGIGHGLGGGIGHGLGGGIGLDGGYGGYGGHGIAVAPIAIKAAPIAIKAPIAIHKEHVVDYYVSQFSNFINHY